MKKILIILCLSLMTSISNAGCLESIKAQISTINKDEKRAISLSTVESFLLGKNEDTITDRGEVYNDTEQTVEVFSIAESNGYEKVFSFILAEASSCIILKSHIYSKSY